MHFTRIEKKEKFLKNKKASQYNMQPFSLAIPDSEEVLEGLVCRPAAGYTNYYYDEQVAKDQIVLHHTAGHLQGDLATLTRENWHVSVAFVIGRDGTIYQLHGSDRWSHHLGPKSLGGNKTRSSRSIGIELSNYGYLVKKGKDMETPYSADQRKKGKAPDVYCSTSDKHLYTKLEIPYRGQQYYATFTDEQYTALVKLLRYLCGTYNIPVAFLDDNDRYNLTEKVVTFKGIVSHVNYRKDKWDLGLAFDWQRLMEELGKERKPVTELQKQLEKAQENYDAAVAAFKEIQVKAWSPKGQNKKTEKELAAAKAVVLEAHSHLTFVQNKTTEAIDAQPVKSRSLQKIFNSEKEIMADSPYVGSRGLTDYGEDGPEEQDLAKYYRR